MRGSTVSALLLMVFVVSIAGAATPSPLLQGNPPPPPASPVGPEPASTVSGVTVVAPKRATVQDFIWRAGAAASNGQLARWRDPICPHAEGVPQVYASYFEARVREAAKTVKAPVADGKCDANLVIYFTPDPTKTLSMLSRKNAFVFGSGKLKAAMADAAAQAPIFWTHNVYDAPADGSSGQRSCRQGGCFLEVDHIFASRLQTPVVDSIGITAVIVDTRKIQGLKFDSVSDYVAMIALGQFKPDDVSPAMPTILNLFKARDAGKPMPSDLTGWDIAYLRGLYATQSNLSAIAQRGKIYQHLREGPGISDDPAR